MNKFDIDVEKLKDELEFVNLSDDDKKKIIEQYILYKVCFSKKLFIDNHSDTNIRIYDGVYKLDKGKKEYLFNEVKMDTSLHFTNCNNTTIIVGSKVNHITLEKCNNVSVKIIGGSITGIDTINCVDMNYMFDDNDIYFMDFSGSTTCNIYISEKIAANTTIITMYSLFINIFVLNKSSSVYKILKLNQNYLNTIGNYTFRYVNDKLELCKI